MNIFPSRITAALDVIKFFDSIKSTQNGEYNSRYGRELTKIEEAVENAAYNCLRDYLSGEIDLGDMPYTKRENYNDTTQTQKSEEVETKTCPQAET